MAVDIANRETGKNKEFLMAVDVVNRETGKNKEFLIAVESRCCQQRNR